VGKRHFSLLGPFASNALENPLLETSQSAKKLKCIAGMILLFKSQKSDFLSAKKVKKKILAILLILFC
jgi:hypothetical protein